MEGLKNFLEENIRLHIIIVIWIFYLWEFYLSSRQWKLMKKLETPPACLDGIMSKDVYQKARNYSMDRSAFNNYSNFFSIVFTTIFIGAYALYYFWAWADRMVELFGLPKDNEMYTCAACMFIMNVASSVLHLPFQLYGTFVLEEKHGFNKQTLGFFVKDQLKKFVVMQLIALPILSVIIWIIQMSGDKFFFYVWSFTFVTTMFLSIVYPEFIAPLFDKYTPLPEGELKNKIEELAKSVNFPLYKLYIVEGSKRSSHSNAYMYGFHKHKRIVLYDTLIKGYRKSENEENSDNEQGCENDEVVAILAHELGHWNHMHVLKSIILSQLVLCMTLLPCTILLNYKPMYAAFGFTDSQPIFIGLVIVIMYILTPFHALIGFLMTMNTRRFEFQADRFGMKLGYAEMLKRSLIKLQKDNLEYPLYDNLYSGWYHSHPPLLERLAALSKTE